MREIFWKLEKLGRVRLSDNFYLRQFLYSEIAAAAAIVNFPDFPELAIETGTMLCGQILEPLQKQFGPLVIRSGFRSARLNAYGAANRLNCAANCKNYAYHIWDHLDAQGHKGAAACIVAPGFNDRHSSPDAWRHLACYIRETLPYHRLTFFTHDNAFNLGWHENPDLEIRPPRQQQKAITAEGFQLRQLF